MADTTLTPKELVDLVKQLGADVREFIAPVKAENARLASLLDDFAQVVELLPARVHDLEQRLAELERQRGR